MERGRDRRKICMWRVGGSFWEKKKKKKEKRVGLLQLFFNHSYSPHFHSCTFLSIQHYMRGAFQSAFVGRGGGGFEGTTPSFCPPTPVDRDLRKVVCRRLFLVWNRKLILNTKVKVKKRKKNSDFVISALKEQTLTNPQLYSFGFYIYMAQK